MKNYPKPAKHGKVVINKFSLADIERLDKECHRRWVLHSNCVFDDSVDERLKKKLIIEARKASEEIQSKLPLIVDTCLKLGKNQHKLLAIIEDMKDTSSFTAKHASYKKAKKLIIN